MTESTVQPIVVSPVAQEQARRIDAMRAAQQAFGRSEMSYDQLVGVATAVLEHRIEQEKQRFGKAKTKITGITIARVLRAGW